MNTDGALLYVSLRGEDLKKLDVTFSKDDGFRRKETDEVLLAVAGVHDEYRLTGTVSLNLISSHTHPV